MNLNENEKAKYYDWLLMEFQKGENMLKSVPTLSLEEQSRFNHKVEYSEENLGRLEEIRNKMNRIKQEMDKLF